MKGKGIYIWKFELVENGDPDRIIELLKEGQFQRVDLKVADGSISMSKNIQPGLIKRIQDEGIEVWGYTFCYGDFYNKEGSVAARLYNELNLDGYIFDVEGRFERFVNAIYRARILGHAFRAGAPNAKLAFCSWPLFSDPVTGRSWHKVALAKEFMKFSDIAAPMCYWGHRGSDAQDAVNWLNWSLDQYRDFTDKPFVPTGRAYVDGWEHSVELKVEAVQAFGRRVRELGLDGESWWRLGWVIDRRPDVWEELKALTPWDGGSPPPPDPEGTEIIVTDEEKRALLSLTEKLR
jgi:hypothetical protein